MKKSVFIILTAIALGVTLTGCNDNSNANDKKDEETVIKENSSQDSEFSKEDQEIAARLEKGIMLYGEGVKGGNYLTTVHNGYSEKITIEEKKQTIYNVVVNLSVKNVRDDNKLVDATELKYELHDKNNKIYNGKVVAKLEPVRPDETIKINVFFEVPNIDDSYKFFVKSKIEPIEQYWVIDNLQKY
ncbi:hypothetical protein [Bacillus sp. JJ722]|uniref:hypothetical protein n=1 Tax=Bacillus sp. JJ722 TaxID=3122973 RepID=UPI003000C8C5